MTSLSSLLKDLTAEDDDEGGEPVAIVLVTGGNGNAGAGDDDADGNGDGGAGGRKAALGVVGASPCACASRASRSCLRASCLSRRRSLMLRPPRRRAECDDGTVSVRWGEKLVCDMVRLFAVIRPAEAGVGAGCGSDTELVSRSGVVGVGCAEGEGWRCGEAGAEDLQ